jgi:hypothetical protein
LAFLLLVYHIHTRRATFTKRTAYDAYKQRQATENIMYQDALTGNLEVEIVDRLHRQNEVRAKTAELSDKALTAAVTAALNSPQWLQTTTTAASKLLRRMSTELAAAIDRVPLPKAAIDKVAKAAMEEQMPDLAEHQARSRAYRHRVNNEFEEIDTELREAVQKANGHQDN